MASLILVSKSSSGIGVIVEAAVSAACLCNSGAWHKHLYNPLRTPALLQTKNLGRDKLVPPSAWRTRRRDSSNAIKQQEERQANQDSEIEYQMPAEAPAFADMTETAAGNVEAARLGQDGSDDEDAG